MQCALELDRRAAGSRHDACSIAEGQLGAFLVGAEWDVDDQQRLFEATAHGLAVHDHHLKRAQRRRQAVEYHADAVANENNVTADQRALRSA